MHYLPPVPVWKRAPFLRLLIPFVMGILVEWYLQWSITVGIVSLMGFIVGSFLFFLLPLAVKFHYKTLPGLFVTGLVFSLGLVITNKNDVRNNDNWYGNFYKKQDMLLVKIDEPLVEKERSLKANGSIVSVIRGYKMIPCSGRILLYFLKDTGNKTPSPVLQFGDKIVIYKDLQPIKNSGNPGAFNYERYAAFQHIFHNVFLKEKDWVLTGTREVNSLRQFIFSSRDYLLTILRNSIKGSAELGIAQALLIGYTNDLDKDLVQAYSNTGVVHIIAISGMHLGLIYVLLVWIFCKIPFLNRSALLQALMILVCLWLFAMITGGSASVVRAAVMFTFIAMGNAFQKQASIYNSLAASAFVMLCYNPYFAWDVGFQLSYLAVVGIILFQKPLYHLLYIKNKLLDKTWQLAAVSLAAQVLTFPVCIFYFHQFPNLFLFTNIVAVPLSTIILYAEIGLVALDWVPTLGFYLGKLVAGLVFIMNAFILWMNKISFAVWDKIPATMLSTLLLYAVVVAASVWLLNKNKHALQVALCSVLLFLMLHNFLRWEVVNQQKMVVYHVSRHRAIDFVGGESHLFIGDRVLMEEGMLQNFNLKPGRIQMQLLNTTDTLNNLVVNTPFYQYNGARILLVDSSVNFERPLHRLDLDIIILSHAPKISIKQLHEVFNCQLYVFDASNSLWKIDKWRKECEELHLRSYSVPEKGAYAVDMNDRPK